jgi:uncharacterized damage-inducible protein DinB
MRGQRETIKQALLHRLTLERAYLWRSFESLPDSELVRRPAIGDWSVKDILAHIADWEEEFIVGIQQAARGEHPRFLDYDDEAFNQAHFLMHKDDTLDQGRQHLREVRQRTLALLNRLSDEEWERPGQPPFAHVAMVAWCVERLAAHDREHWPSIMIWRQEVLARLRQAEWEEAQRAPAG